MFVKNLNKTKYKGVSGQTWVKDRLHGLETHHEEEEGEEGELSSSDSSSSEAGTSLSSISSAEDLEDEPQTKEDTSPPPCIRIMVVPASKHK